jgi:hypothetical protein
MVPYLIVNCVSMYVYSVSINVIFTSFYKKKFSDFFNDNLETDIRTILCWKPLFTINFIKITIYVIA